MTAYELAKYLEIAFYEDEDIEKAANMLREQADRIAELKNKSKPLSDEEILNEWIGNDRRPYYFAKAIEERHGIK